MLMVKLLDISFLRVLKGTYVVVSCEYIVTLKVLVFNDQREVPIKDAKEFAEKEGLFFLNTSPLEAINVETSFMTVLTKIFNIVNKKNLAADENQGNDNSTSLFGKKIIIPGPAQVIPAK
ncbi:hypothetical protein RYX36_009796, partial [Vicia faba]